jgi:Ni,Fe-hydrogenase III large subunit
LDIHIPERAHYIRTILLEVERLHSHLLNLGLACHFVGFDTGFMQFFRVREKAMKMAELLTGTRKTYGMNLIGGVRRDILKEERTQTLQWLKELRKEVTDLVGILLAPYIVSAHWDRSPDIRCGVTAGWPTLRVRVPRISG